MKILEREGLTFDDVLLVPCHSTVHSRFDGEVDLSPGYFCSEHKQLRYPIISANMDTVTELAMATTINNLGGAGIIHRFMPIEKQAKQLAMLPVEGYKIACIGVGEEAQKRMAFLEPWCDGVLIDVAHGDSIAVVDQIKWVKDNWPHLYVIAGNIATGEAAARLITAGANCLKVGVGPGSLCTTRIKTGCGVPQLTAIVDVAEVIKEVNTPIQLIADGGIRNSGDIVKALAAGADMAMVGGLFAGADETPGRLYHGEKEGMYKIYRGMASRAAQEDWKGYATSIEGEMRRVPYKGPVQEIFDELISGILSGMSYLDAHNLKELRENAVFIRQTANGYRESTPHGL